MNLNLIYEALPTEQDVTHFNAGKTQHVSIDQSNNTVAIDAKMVESVLEKKSPFQMLGLSFSSKLDWNVYCYVYGSSSKYCQLKFYTYYFGRFSSELAPLVWLPYSWGRSTCYSDRLHDFSGTNRGCYKGVYVNSFFHCIAKLCNSLK